MNTRVLFLPIACAAVMFLPCFKAHAQWSTDPAAPLAVCDATGDQGGLRAMPDGNGGWFAFWTDKRLDGVNREIYGQHLDADGYALWTANGELLRSEPAEDIKEFAAVVLEDGNILLAYIFGPSIYRDSLCAMAYDPAGQPLWATTTTIADIGISLIGLDQVTAITTAGGAYVGWYDNYFGGSNGVNVSRINNDGSLAWGPGGFAIPNAFYGPFELHSDYASGVMVQWRTGNGSGAALFAMRVDPEGSNSWSDNVQTSANNGGLSYAFHTVKDDEGAQITAWRDVAGDILMARLDTSGTLTFPSSPLPVCTYASYHDTPRLIMSGGSLFVAWADNRPPASNYDLFLQKFDADGAPLWTVDGILEIQINTYMPTTGLIASDSGAVIATFDGNVTGYSAMRVLPDGSQAWATPGLFCIPAFNPFYANQVQLPDGEGGIVSFWQTSGNDLYAARIYKNGDLGVHTGIAEEAAAGFSVQPNPARDRITITWKDDLGNAMIRMLATDGRVLETYRSTLGEGTTRTFDIASLEAGCYLIQIDGTNGSSTQRFIKN